jgi:hypothetical protein
LTLLLKDPDPRVKKVALLAVEYRAELGADIGMAVPMLDFLLDDDEEEIREIAWRAIQFADQRLGGISDIVESRHPDFVFGRSTRTTICPSIGPSIGPDTNPLTGAWGKEPYATEQAREFILKLFLGVDIDKRVEDALRQEGAFNSIRAAAYLLEFLGFTRVWPGDPNHLPKLISRTIFLLKAMLDPTLGDPDSEFLERWNNDEDIVISIEKQISALSRRLQN